MAKHRITLSQYEDRYYNHANSSREHSLSSHSRVRREPSLGEQFYRAKLRSNPSPFWVREMRYK